MPQSSDKPIIGLSLDWKVKTNPTTGERDLSYSGFQGNLYMSYIQQCGGIPYVLGYDEPVESYQHLIDGFLIAGGRDLDPKHYGEPIDGSIVPPDAEERWDMTERAYRSLPRECPILGICWGLQFLNVVQGGSLVQNITDKKAHYCKRSIHFKPGSWFQQVCGLNMKSLCLHHQVINKIGHNVEVVGYDDHSKYIHAIQVHEEGRFIVATQSHPESTFRNETFREIDSKNLMIGKAFVDKCAEYKRLKANR
jgi:putative glutamine amidotransferase